PSHKHCVEGNLRTASAKQFSTQSRARSRTGQHFRPTLTWRDPRIPKFHAWPFAQNLFPTPITPCRQIIVCRSLTSATIVPHDATHEPLSLNASPLRLDCLAEEHIFLWRRVNTPPPSTIDHPIVCLLAEAAGRASLQETASYGSGIRKFHLFCNIFSIPEPDRLPVSFELLHSFALWAVSDPSTLNPIARDPAAESIPFEPVLVTVVKKYLSAIHTWHLAQGWSPPLSAENLTRISWSLRGLENLQGACRKPLRPPVMLQKLTAIKATLKLDQPFDACIWAIASCSFFGMMRFSKVSVRTHTEFNASKHITRKDVLFGVDLNGKSYARLDLPSAKMAKPGETQSVFLVEQGNLCPLEALRNLARVIPASPNDPFKVDPEIVRIAGRWKSLAYETYIRAFEQVASQHLGNLS
ncbi:hypothetical protein BDR06DRAFT_946350, partial [Suillus hirtellus]